MTADTPYLVRLGELQEDAAKLLFRGLPEDGWASCVLDYREAGPVIEVVARMSDNDGNSHPVAPPSALLDALGHLRKYMAEHGNGVWLSAQLKLGNGRFAFDFNYGERPNWRVAPTDDAYVDDLSRFPRPDDHIPEWYPRES